MAHPLPDMSVVADTPSLAFMRRGAADPARPQAVTGMAGLPPSTRTADHAIEILIDRIEQLEFAIGEISEAHARQAEAAASVARQIDRLARKVDGLAEGGALPGDALGALVAAVHGLRDRIDATDAADRADLEGQLSALKSDMSDDHRRLLEQLDLLTTRPAEIPSERLDRFALAFKYLTDRNVRLAEATEAHLARLEALWTGPEAGPETGPEISRASATRPPAADDTGRQHAELMSALQTLTDSSAARMEEVARRLDRLERGAGDPEQSAADRRIIRLLMGQPDTGESPEGPPPDATSLALARALRSVLAS